MKTSAFLQRSYIDRLDDCTLFKAATIIHLFCRSLEALHFTQLKISATSLANALIRLITVFG